MSKHAESLITTDRHMYILLKIDSLLQWPQLLFQSRHIGEPVLFTLGSHGVRSGHQKVYFDSRFSFIASSSALIMFSHQKVKLIQGADFNTNQTEVELTFPEQHRDIASASLGWGMWPFNFFHPSANHILLN